MASDLEAEIGDAERVALNYARAAARPRLAAFFALDRRLGQIVASSNEPMLGQMRLAWWRDMLKVAPEDRPAGDIVLDSIGESWAGQVIKLDQLIDAWEIFLTAEKLSDEVLAEFANGRAGPLAATMEKHEEKTAGQIVCVGTLWALADTAAYVSDEAERSAILEMAKATIHANRSGKPTPKVFAVLNALARRAITRGGRPLMEGRGAALTALRAGLIGK